MPHYWVQRVQDGLNEATMPVKGGKTPVPGADPHAPSFHHKGMEMASVRDLDAALGEADCVVITMDHSVVDWTKIARVASMVVDTQRMV